MAVPLEPAQYDALSLLVLVSGSVAITLIKNGRQRGPLHTLKTQPTRSTLVNVVVAMFPALFLMWLFSTPSQTGPGTYVQFDLMPPAFLVMLVLIAMIISIIGIARRRLTGKETLKDDRFMRIVGYIILGVILPLRCLLSPMTRQSISSAAQTTPMQRFGLLPYTRRW